MIDHRVTAEWYFNTFKKLFPHQKLKKISLKWNLIQNSENDPLWEPTKQTEHSNFINHCKSHDQPRTSWAPPWRRYKGRLQSSGWQRCARPSWANPQTASSRRGTCTRVSTSPRSYKEASRWSYSLLRRLIYGFSDQYMEHFLFQMLALPGT